MKRWPRKNKKNYDFLNFHTEFRYKSAKTGAANVVQSSNPMFVPSSSSQNSIVFDPSCSIQSFFPSNVQATAVPSSGYPSMWNENFNILSQCQFPFYTDFAVPQNQMVCQKMNNHDQGFALDCIEQTNYKGCQADEKLFVVHPEMDLCNSSQLGGPDIFLSNSQTSCFASTSTCPDQREKGRILMVSENYSNKRKRTEFEKEDEDSQVSDENNCEDQSKFSDKKRKILPSFQDFLTKLEPCREFYSLFSEAGIENPKIA